MIKLKSAFKIFTSLTPSYYSTSNLTSQIHKLKKKNLQSFFTIYASHQELFQTEGLFNTNSQKIKEALTTKQIEIIESIKFWLQGKIQFKDLSSKQITVLFSIIKLITKNGFTPFIPLLKGLDDKIKQMLVNQRIQQDNLEKSMEILRYLKSRQNQHASIMAQKINAFIIGQQKPTNAQVEIIFNQCSQQERFRHSLTIMLGKIPLQLVMKLDIPHLNLPHSIFKQNIPLLCNYIHRQLSNPIFLGIKKLQRIFNLLSPYQKQKQILNQTIYLMEYLIQWAAKKGEQFLSERGIYFMQQILSNKQAALILHYQMATRMPASKGTFNYQMFTPVKKLRLNHKLLLSIILHKQYSQSNKHVIEVIDKQIQVYFQTLPKFLSFYRQAKQIYFPNLIKEIGWICHKYFMGLPNPFQPSCNEFGDTSIKADYMHYLFMVYSFKDKQIFIKKYYKQLDCRLISKVIAIHLSQPQQTFRPDKYYNYLLISNFKLAIATSNKELLDLGLQFLIKYRIIAIQRTQNQYTELKVWNLVGKYVQYTPKILSLGVNKNFFQMIENYIKVQSNYYKLDYHFKQMITQLLKFLNIFEKYPHIFYLILQQALKLNLINKTHLQTIQTVKLDSQQLKKEQILKISCLKGQAINIDALNEQTIQALLVNPQYLYIIEQKHQQIMEFLSKASDEYIFKCLAAYNLPNTPSNELILKLLLTQSAQRLQSKKIHMIDFISIYQSCIRLGYYYMQQYRILFHKLIERLFYRIQYLTFESHIKLIRYIHTQIKEKMNKKLIRRYLKFVSSQSRKQNIQYSTTLLNLNYTIAMFEFDSDPKQLAFVYTLLKTYNPKLMKTHALQFMLLLQEQLNEYQMKNIIDNFVKYYQILKQRDAKQYFVFDLHYEYLKKTHPKLCMKLQIAKDHIYPFSFTNKHPNIYMNIVDMICKELNCSSTTLTNFGNNKLIQIKSTVLVFLSPDKNGCLKEHNLLKKMIGAGMLVKEISVVFVHFYDPLTYEIGMLNSIAQNSRLLTQQQLNKLKTVINKQNQENNCTIVTQPLHQEDPQGKQSDDQIIQIIEAEESQSDQ